MNKLHFLLIFCFGIHLLPAQSQYIPSKEDWFFYDLSHVRLLEGPAGFENSAWGNGHSLSLMREHIVGNSNFSYAYGLGFTSNNFINNLRVQTDPVSGASEFRIIPESDSYQQNKTTVQYFEIPLELRFRSKPGEKGNFFRVYAGGRFGVRFNAYSKYQDEFINVRHYHPDELNRWRAGVYTRIGYGSFSLYAYYGLLDLFDYDLPPEDFFADDVDVNGMQPVAVGVSFSL